MADDETLYEEEGGFWQRVKESPRTVSALIVILIVAAAIYAFSGDQGTDQATELTGEVAATDDAAGTSDEQAGQVAAETDEAMVAEEAGEPLPEPRRTGEGYVEVAQPGEGYTHLARRASTRWLSENQAAYEVTAEHRIYIEDYIQNQLGTRGLALGEEQTITFAMVQEAVVSAGDLTEAQLQNLSKYTSTLQE